MLKSYGAGFRAGMAEPGLKRNPDGSNTFVLATPVCPFIGRWQFVQRELWHFGLWDGSTKRILNASRVAI